MTTKQEADGALLNLVTMVVFVGQDNVTCRMVADAAQTIRARMTALEAQIERLLDEISDTACPKCDGTNGVWAEGGAWVKCPRCGE